MILENDKIYKNADLAAWFGVTSKSFSNRKKHYLEILRQYADFEEVKGKIYIIQVFESEYHKICSINRKIVHEHYDEAWPGPEEQPYLNTISGATNILYEKYEKSFTATENSVYRCMLQETNIRYGNGRDNEKGGTDGYRKTVWSTIDKDTNQIRALNEKEHQLLNELKKKYYDIESDIEFDEYALIEQGELPQSYTKKINAKKQEAFRKVRRLWINKTGQTLIKATQLYRQERII